MRQLLLAGVTALVLTTGARAADPVIYAPVTDWSGFFAGIQGGHGWGDVDYDFLDPAALFDPADVSGSFEAEGWLGGLYYGRNWQSGNWVYGLEGSISFADLKDSITTDDIIGALTVDGVDIADDTPVTLEVGLKAFSTTRAKIGYAFDNVLVFAAGGLTVGRLEAELSGDLGSVDDDEWAFGWTVGAGIEAKFSDSWSGRLEYLYLNYGDETFFGGTDGEVDVEVDAHVVRAGIAYHF